MKLLLLLCSLAAVTSFAQDAAKPSKWEGEVQKYEAAEKANPPPEGKVVFNGSSTIRLWKLEKSFPGWDVVNHGIGGSIIPENTELLDRLIFPLAPKVIVFYAGDNDIAKGHTPTQVLENWKAYVTAVRAKLPKVKIIYLAIKPSPSRWKLRPQGKSANMKIRAWSKTQKDVIFLNTVVSMLDGNGKPIDALFMPDKLHMNDKGYAAWTKLLKPLIQSVAKPSSKR
jgi:lysophospholipase L1-like esterase